MKQVLCKSIAYRLGVISDQMIGRKVDRKVTEDELRHLRELTAYAHVPINANGSNVRLLR